MFQPVIAPKQLSAFGCKTRSTEDAHGLRFLCVGPELALDFPRLGSLEGFETSVVSYTTDIPAFAAAWGRPLLFGPGSIHFAHTDAERVPKRELLEAVEIYQKIVRRLLRQETTK